MLFCNLVLLKIGFLCLKRHKQKKYKKKLPKKVSTGKKVLMLSKFEAIQAMIQLGARVICRQRIEGTPLCVALASVLCFGHGSSFAQESLGLNTGESSEGGLVFFDTNLRPIFIERF